MAVDTEAIEAEAAELRDANRALEVRCQTLNARVRETEEGRQREQEKIKAERMSLEVAEERCGCPCPFLPFSFFRFLLRFPSLLPFLLTHEHCIVCTLRLGTCTHFRSCAAATAVFLLCVTFRERQARKKLEAKHASELKVAHSEVAALHAIRCRLFRGSGALASGSRQAARISSPSTLILSLRSAN